LDLKAWEFAAELLRGAVPVVLSEAEQTWDATLPMQRLDAERTLFWRSNVPGSGAPECLMAAALQSMENQGFVLAPYEALLRDGLAALDAGDMERLHVADMRLKGLMRAARPDPAHPSQRSLRFASFAAFDAQADWPADAHVDVNAPAFAQAMAAAWMGQLVGAAAGTALEGYTMERLAAAFGPIRDYVRPPNTLNDDITFEIAFLEAYAKAGPAVTSADIAAEWVALIPSAWSAEAAALANLQRGVLPPESAREGNPFDEWIGAQMRGAICGMMAPGRAREAARLAWIDAEISHTGNGILGEVFNAILVAGSFARRDMRALLIETVALFPDATEYGAVLRFALRASREAARWQDAWLECDARLVEYNWIHAYPNAAAEVVALWWGDGDFDRTLEIVCGIGHDVDCNAAQILSAVAVAAGPGAIAARWTEPLGEDIVTYMRRPARIGFDALVAQTVAACRSWMRPAAGAHA
jgi:ADP-ribosylglycohydrolase